jgi:fibronectin type 3 domain-containing protein
MSYRRAVASFGTLLMVAGAGTALVADASRPAAGPIARPQAPREAPQVRSTPVASPLAFVANTGTLDERVAFWLPGTEASVYLTDSGLTYRLAKPATPADAADAADATTPSAPPAWVVRQDFLGAAPVRPVASQDAPGTVSFFKGAPDQWVTSVPTAAAVTYRQLWPGVDATYGGDGHRLKYEFTLAPGTDPASVRLAYRGAAGVTLTPTGDLRVDSPAGGFTDAAPTAYQLVGGERRPVRVSYALGSREPDGGQPYGFVVDDHDPALPLVIDPATIVYAGFIGGGNGDEGYGNAVDASGNQYVAGVSSSVQSATFPATVGPDLTSNGINDAFVAKVDPSGALVYAGYIGGTGSDNAWEIAVDEDGAAYVTGRTQTSDGTFPTVGGLDSTYNGGSWDIFVAKVAPDGSSLLFSGFIGGSGDDEGHSISLGDDGSIYLTGRTRTAPVISGNCDDEEVICTRTYPAGTSTFPATGGPDTTDNGNYDAFVAKLAPDGTGPLYAGYIGGSGDEEGWAVKTDGAGRAYVAGYTTSSEATFPVGGGPDSTYAGGTDSFVAKVAPGGATLDFATYLGGSGSDTCKDLGLDSAGNMYLTGGTTSTEATFPVVGGPDTTANGGSDAFVAKLRADASGYDYAGFIGGSADDAADGLAVDAYGGVYLAAVTSSTEADLPVSMGPDLTANGARDGLVAKVAPNGLSLPYLGFIGGDANDGAYDVAVAADGTAYFTGGTSSTEATFPVQGGPGLVYHGTVDALMVKLTAGPPPPVTGLSATATSATRIGLTWDPVGGATSYEVFRSDSAGGAAVGPKVVTTNGYGNNGRTPGTTYYYTVYAVGPGGTSIASAEVSATTPAQIAAPTNLTVTGTTATSVSLQWDAVAGAGSYQLRRSTTPGGSYSPVGSSGGTSATDTTAQPGVTYYYVVVATGAGGTSANSNEASATTASLPAPPTGVTATTVNATRVQVSWSAVGGASGYEVWHSLSSGGPFTKVATVGGTSYLHTGASPGTVNYYVVRTKASTGTSGNSASASTATPPLPAAPAGVGAAAVNSTRVSVSWGAVTGATSYEVWRSTVSGGPYAKKATVAGTSYTDTTVSAATTYYYVVRTVDANGTSPNSGEATVTTP